MSKVALAVIACAGLLCAGCSHTTSLTTTRIDTQTTLSSETVVTPAGGASSGADQVVTPGNTAIIGESATSRVIERTTVP